MASLAELARARTELAYPQIAHLQRLVATWGLLADFCFADLLLYVPERQSRGNRFVVLGQVRPQTGQTVYRRDWVGEVMDETERPLVARSHRLGEIIEGEINIDSLKERVRVLGIPVRHDGHIIGVLTRESTPSFGRAPGELERTYVDIFNRFARMIAAGDFPYAKEQLATDEVPRVGDGVLLLDRHGRVEYSSPNAVSALHRIGVHAATEGLRLDDLGVDETPIRTALSSPCPVTVELERGSEISVVLRCIPLLEKGQVSGAVVLLRDISELRRRDRLLLSKDATIREIHHRVKNNLQTISSLLRLQGRRLASSEAKAAIEESVRRVRSIALVHEILSREAGDDVPFVDIVRPLCRMVEEALCSAERPVRCRVEGDAGTLPAMVATPLAVVLNELLQNAYDHAYPEDGPAQTGEVVVRLEKQGSELVVDVSDDGVGLPDGFAIEAATGLGLSIVRTLVQSELEGEIEMRRGDGEDGRPGTVVQHAGVDREPGVTPAVVVGQEALRWRASHARRSLRRSSSEVPPQTPESWLVTRANSRHSACTAHSPQTALAAAICSRAGPVVPTGKNRSGLVSRQAASSRQSAPSIEYGSADRDRANSPPHRSGKDLAGGGIPARIPSLVTTFTCHPKAAGGCGCGGSGDHDTGPS